MPADPVPAVEIKAPTFGVPTVGAPEQPATLVLGQLTATVPPVLPLPPGPPFELPRLTIKLTETETAPPPEPPPPPMDWAKIAAELGSTV